MWYKFNILRPKNTLENDSVLKWIGIKMTFECIQTKKNHQLNRTSWDNGQTSLDSTKAIINSTIIVHTSNKGCPRNSDTQTMMLPKRVFSKYLLTNCRGTWTTIPKRKYNEGLRKATEQTSSWARPETKNVTKEANGFDALPYTWDSTYTCRKHQ